MYIMYIAMCNFISNIKLGAALVVTNAFTSEQLDTLTSDPVIILSGIAFINDYSG